jgi:hypothetical protein
LKAGAQIRTRRAAPHLGPAKFFKRVKGIDSIFCAQ